MEANRKKCIVVFSGFNQRAVITFLRTMESKGVDYLIIAKSKQDDIFFTKYKNKVLAIRDSEPLVLRDLLLSIKKVKEKHFADEYIIAPTTEALNRFILENREEFEKLRCTIPLVEKRIYELISNKYSFGQLCLENQILVPKEINLDLKISFPIVAKPKEYYSSVSDEILSPIIINNNEELTLFFKKYNTDDFYYQEFVEGKSLYLLYYVTKDGQIFKFSQENLIQQPNGKSMIAAISTDFHNSSESYKYEKIFKCLNYNGFVMVEVKQNKNKNYMIEANPRFWGPSQLFVDAGINLFEVFLYDYGLIKSLPNFKDLKEMTRYFWFGGLISTIKNDLNLSYHNIPEDDFLNLLPKWIENDIYKRDDTIEIFREELING